MRKILIAFALLASAVPSACSSSGPDPAPDPSVPAVRGIWSTAVQSSGESSPRYVGDVAIDETRVFLVQEHANNGGSLERALFSVAKDGSSPALLADNLAVPFAARIALDRDFVYFANAKMDNSVDLLKIPKTGGAPAKLGTTVVTSTNTHTASGVLVDGQTVYVVVDRISSDTNDPTQPSSSDSGPGVPVLIAFDKVSGMATTLDGQPKCRATCLYADSGALFWFEAAGQGSQLVKYGVTTKTKTTVATLDPGAEPVALAFNASSIVWAQHKTSNGPMLGCTIVRLAKSGGAAQKIVDDPGIECRDLAIDDTTAYYPLVRSYSGGGGPNREGYAIGHVLLQGGAPMITPLYRADTYGVLRLRLDGSTLYGLDPQHILAIPKSLLSLPL